MTIPTLPSLDRTSPTFRTDLDTFFLTQLPATVTAMNVEITRIDGILPAGYVASSTTSLAIAASGTVTLTTQTGKGFAAGQFLAVSVTADPTVQMSGTVTAYDVTTGVLSFTASSSAGTGTYAAWTVAMTTAQASPYAVGDLLLTNRALTLPEWLPATGGTYAQASYADLYAEVGLLPSVSTNTSALVTVSATKSWTASAAQGTKAVLVSNDSGSSTVASYSTDSGATWTASTLPAANNWAAVSFGATGHVMAVAPGATVAAYSTDSGATWASRTTPVGFKFILYLNGLWIGIPATSTTSYYTSPSGDNGTWTTRTLPALPANFFYGAVAQNGTAVLCPGNYNGWVLTSTDGTTWTQRTMPVTPAAWAGAAVTSSGHIYIFPHTTATAYISTDAGANWTPFTLPSVFAGVSAVAFGGEIFVVPADTTAKYLRITGTTASQLDMPSGVYGQGASVNATHVIAPRTTSANSIVRIGRYSYDPATQFAVPQVQTASGVTAYIKT